MLLLMSAFKQFSTLKDWTIENKKIKERIGRLSSVCRLENNLRIATSGAIMTTLISAKLS